MIQKIDCDGIIHQQVIIAYIDQKDSAYMPFVVPCRRARIREIQDYGATLTIVLELEGLAFAPDVQECQQVFRSAGQGHLPDWKDRKLDGKWFLSLNQEVGEIRDFNDETSWHAIVNQLAARSEFDIIPFFFKILGLKKASDTKYPNVERTEKWYTLSTTTEYIFDVYHYHPTRETTDYSFQLSAGQETALKIFSASTLIIDSRYDQKRFRLKTGSSTTAELSVLILEVVKEKGDRALFQFAIPIKIRANLPLVVVKAVSIGIFVAIPSILAMVAADKFSFGTMFLMLISGVAAGFASTYLLPKSA